MGQGQWSDQDMRINRAKAGGQASARSPKRKYPLRKVVKDFYTHELLECGHEIRKPVDMIGPTNAFRRRCRQCYDGKNAESL